MAMPIIPKAIYPLVPNLPGVPILLRSGAVIIDTLTGNLFGLTDALDELLGTNPIQWGLFNADGTPVAVSDSVASLGYRNSSRLPDYPVEEGGFGTYNKVATPYDVRVRLSKGGTEEERSQFLNAIQEAAKTTDLYVVLTPEVTYHDANIEGIEYVREPRGGAYFITVDIFLREIRTVVTAAFNTPKAVNSASPESSGQVQTHPVTQSVIKATDLKPLV